MKNQSVENSDYEANLAAKVKNDKYKAACEARNLKFVPFVVYTSGKFHEDAKSLRTSPLQPLNDATSQAKSYTIIMQTCYLHV